VVRRLLAVCLSVAVPIGALCAPLVHAHLDDHHGGHHQANRVHAHLGGHDLDDHHASSEQGLAMLGLMQQLTFHSASLRWDDSSLTNKAIDYVAKSQNMSADDIKNQAKAIVPFLAAQLNNAELSSLITAAVTKYLDDPKSLQISATPPAPVPFAQIAATGMANPVDLTKTLGVTVKANE